MATSPRSTVIPLRKATRARLEAIRWGRTFDDVILAILDAADPAALVVPTVPTALPSEPPDRRTPAKQRLLARAAEAAWQRAQMQGIVTRLGPRSILWRPPTPTAEVLRVSVEPDRGLPS